jgi:hypothetical protein
LRCRSIVAERVVDAAEQTCLNLNMKAMRDLALYPNQALRLWEQQLYLRPISTRSNVALLPDQQHGDEVCHHAAFVYVRAARW